MAIWSAATITRFVTEGEKEIAKAIKCLVTRVSLATVVGTAEYTLPTDCLFTTRITWKGKELEPMPAREFHAEDNTTAQSEPLWYVFNQIGRNKVKFHPVPSEAFSLVVDDDDLWGPAIGTSVIVEYYQVPSDTVPIPVYIRRRLIKYYVLKSCFGLEGKGQNLKAAKKFQERFDFYLAIFKRIYSDTFIAKNPTLGGGSQGRMNAPPRLSYKYGVGVDQ